MENNNLSNLNPEDTDESSGESTNSSRSISPSNPAPTRSARPSNPAPTRSNANSDPIQWNFAWPVFAAAGQNRTPSHAPAQEREIAGQPPPPPPSTPRLPPLVGGPIPLPPRARRDALTPLDTAFAQQFRHWAAPLNPLRPRLSETELKSLPQRPITPADLDDQGEAQCNICIQSLAIGEIVCCLHCGHYYHRECLVAWFAKSNSCPSCRRIYVPLPPPRDYPPRRRDDEDPNRRGGGSSGRGGVAQAVLAA